MTVELVLFVIFALVAVAGALAVVFSRNPVYSAIGLLATMVALAVLYVVQSGALRGRWSRSSSTPGR